ncbi:hypothetical protein CFAEC_06085 [Corynebacterium faecale]|uniref:hypothetical protein n=1 Tax=Corynebacterium faecale TaxID=1758466 RepID=UPI0025B5C7E5|nr:hypothetical protein [Corynebacterium faecale]WJY92053.1 hypothetical protein CFAEC_06085 [Corynebacterium faecale]
MTNSNLDQAREWADCITTTPNLSGPRVGVARAAAELIQSLPDQWIDAEKVRALITSLNAWAEDADAERAPGRVLGYRTAAENLVTLLPATHLPTLAELIEQGNDTNQYYRMQCRIAGSDRRFTIRKLDLDGKVLLLRDDFLVVKSSADMVTPLPDPPRPEDVPHDEVWLVRKGELEDLACRGKRSS